MKTIWHVFARKEASKLRILQIIEFVFLMTALMMIFKIQVFGNDEKFSIQGSNLKSKRDIIIKASSGMQTEKIPDRLRRLIRMTGTSQQTFYLMEAFSFAFGAVAGMMLFKGIFLMMATGAACMVLPIYYLMYKDKIRSRKEEADIEEAMTQITNNYMSMHDIEKSVAVYLEEKNQFIPEKIRKRTVFDEFLIEVNLVDPNVKRALAALGNKVKNNYFKEWVRVLILCHGDRNLKFGLKPMIHAMNDEKTNQMESDTQMAVAWRTYFMTMGFCFGLPQMIGYMYEDWYFSLVKTAFGQFLILLQIIAALLISYWVIHITRKKQVAIKQYAKSAEGEVE